MKNLFLFSLIYLISNPSFGQNNKILLHGSFVFEKQVFQYQYRKEGGINFFKLSTLAQQETKPIFDQEKLKRTEDFISKTTNMEFIKHVKDTSEYLKNASTGILDTITLLPQYISQLKTINNSKELWKIQYEKIDQLIEIFNNYKIEQIKFDDSLENDIYNVNEMLTTYKDFLNKISEPQTTEEIPFTEIKLEEFKVIFKDELAKLYFKEIKSFGKLENDVDRKATDIMYEIKARAEFKDDEPITAYVSLKRKFIDIRFQISPTKKSNKKSENQPPNFKVIKFEIKNVILEFEDGGIKNIFVDMLPLVDSYQKLYGQTTIRFRNYKPVGITGKFDPDRFKKVEIYSGNSLELIDCILEEVNSNNSKVKFTKDEEEKIESNEFMFILSNILDYKVVSENDNEDYSPTNSKIELSEPNSVVELKKENRSKILSARAYTDFIGLSDVQPNGLIQIEVSKRVNLIPGRRTGILCIGSDNRRGIYSGGLTYIEPRFTISKIEDNNRFLFLNPSHLDTLKSFDDSSSHFLVSPLEIIRFQQWSFGTDVNLLKLNIHNRKSNFQINGYFYFGSTSIADSIKINSNSITPIQSQNISRVNTTFYGLGIMYEVKPDSRYGFSLGYDLKWIDVLNNNFEYDKKFNNQFHSAWFNGTFKVNDGSKLFWRFKKNWLARNSKQNFYQIQLGYEIDIFKTSK